MAAMPGPPEVSLLFLLLKQLLPSFLDVTVSGGYGLFFVGWVPLKRKREREREKKGG